MAEDDVAEIGGVEVGVLLGCGELLVTEQDLDVADVHSRLQEMGGAGMAKQVRRDVLLDAGLVSILLESLSHRRVVPPGAFFRKPDSLGVRSAIALLSTHLAGDELGSRILQILS
tara:strand:+ start:207 stop:551 length:345 start_codon:yes stop_codon:yes gene_type:complete